MPWIMQVFVDDRWETLRIPDIKGVPCLYCPYRYEDRKDAETMLERLYPDLTPNRKQVIREEEES